MVGDRRGATISKPHIIVKPTDTPNRLPDAGMIDMATPNAPADDVPSVARSTAIMSVATTLSRLTGFVRMWVTAVALATGAVASAYNVANNVPNMIFELVAGGILSSVFIPTLLEIREEDGEEASWKFASQVMNIAVLMLGVVAVVGTVLPEPFIWTQTFRMSAESGEAVRSHAEFFFRFFAIQVVVYGIGMVIQAVLSAQRKFLWTALGPVFNNLVVIVTMIVVATMPLTTGTMVILASGTTLGVVAMFAVMIPALRKTSFRYTPSLGLNNPHIKKMAFLATPAIVYVVTNLITVSFRNASALAVSDAGPSVLMYAWTWYQLPYGILAVALATAIFTEMSSFAAKKDITNFKITFASGLRSTAVLIVPTSALLFALATPLTTLYMAGRFSAEDVAPVAEVLRGWSVGLSFFALMMFVLRAFYSLRDTKTPAKTNIVTSAVQIGGYMLLTTGLGTWAGFGLLGIPISDTLFYLLQFSSLLVLMRRKIGPFDFSSFLRVLAKTVAVAVGAGLVASGVSGAFTPEDKTMGTALIQVTAGGLAGLTTMFVLAKILGIEEIEIATSLVRKVRRKIIGR